MSSKITRHAGLHLINKIGLALFVLHSVIKISGIQVNLTRKRSIQKCLIEALRENNLFIPEAMLKKIFCFYI